MTSIFERAEQILAEAKQHLWPSSPPWVGFQGWRDLLFASWSMPIEEVRSVVPPQLEVDSQDGRAWISLVPMRVQGAHFRDVEPIPGLDHFCEINLRTYVKLGDERGVYFITIDCSDSIADWLGQKLFGVPFYRANIALVEQDGGFYIASRRTQSDMPAANFVASFQPTGDPFPTSADPMAQFLLERYFLALSDKDGSVHRVNIQHPAWSIRRAEPTISVNTICSAGRLTLSGRPPDHVVYSLGTDTLIYPPVEIRQQDSPR
jgi:uncharacterized protein YqjF (DUF2071 family)